MDFDPVKDRLQNEAVEAIINNSGRGLIVKATGTGKSRIPILYLQKKPELKKIALIVPTEKLRDVNWKKEFEDWGESELYNTLERYCYQSIDKIKGKEYDLVILDEAHHITINNFDFFRNNKVKDIIGLTATYPKAITKTVLFDKLGLDTVYEVSLDTAEELNVVAPFKIKVIYTKLNPTDKIIKAGSKTKPFYQTELSAYKYIDRLINELYEKAEKEGVPVNREKLKELSLRRARFIYNLPSKTLAASKILSHISKDERTLIFCGSISQAETVEKQTYHSKTKDTYLKLFMEEKISKLSCVGALNEGMNIKNVDTGIIVQVNSNDLNLVQRLGRLIRKRPGHEAILYIICCKDTQDEVWLKESLKNFQPEKITFHNISEYA